MEKKDKKEEKKIDLPCFMYHAKEGAKLIKTEEEFKSLGSSWKDTPAAFAKKEEAKGDVKK